jgi:hypothetical protein
VTEQTGNKTPLAKALPWLLGVCLLCLVGFMALGALEALTGSPLLARSTPTPELLPGREVVLAGPDGAAVTVWQVGGDCTTANAYGQVPSGSEARVLEAACYNGKGRTHYQRIALANGSTGWVAAGDMLPAAEYTPPPPTETPELEPPATSRPTSLAQSPPTAQPTRTPRAEPLPMGSALYTANWGARVDRVQIADVVTSAAGDKSAAAEGRFALLFLTIANRSNRPQNVHASTLYIEDGQGIQYRNDNLASAYASVAECQDFALDVAPDESVCLVAAIDIPVGGGPYLLSLDGAGDSILLDVP